MQPTQPPAHPNLKPLREVLNPAGEGKGQKVFGGTVYRVGDKVLQLRNNYEKEVFNGDGGVITGISHEIRK